MNKQRVTTKRKLQSAERLLKNMGLSESIKELWSADDETIDAAGAALGRDMHAALRLKQSQQPIDWEAEYTALQLPTVQELQQCDTIDQFKERTPRFCIAEVVQEIEATSNGKTRTFGVGQKICIMDVDYRRINDQMRRLQPATPTFKETYKRYDGQNLDGKTLSVWRSGGIGDLMFIRPILCHLKKLYPTCTVKFSTQEKYHDLVKYWEDAIDQLSDVYFNAESMLYSADYHLSFEGVIEKCGDAETMDVHDLFARLAGLDPEEIDWQVPMEAPLDNAFLIGNTEPYALIQPRASISTRTPMLGTIVEAINQCTNRGLRVVIADSPIGRRTAEDIKSACDHPDRIINFAKYTTGLHDLVGLVDGACLVISPDSAFTHAAAMQGKPNLAFYGPFPASVRTERYPLCVALEPEKSNVCPHSGRGCFLHAHMGICEHDCACWSNLSRETVRDAVNAMLDTLEGR